MQSPASTEKDSDSGCCADMSNHEDNGNHLHMNGKKISCTLRKLGPLGFGLFDNSVIFFDFAHDRWKTVQN